MPLARDPKDSVPGEEAVPGPALYDLTRQAYRDAHEIMENIDLDYGADVAAIAIKTIARLTCP